VSSEPLPLDDRTAKLLRDAAEWRLLSRLLECPDDRWRNEVAALAGEIGAGDVRAAVDAIDASATPGQYYSVFGPGGPAPPREATYHESVELGSLMSELASYYNMFGYAPNTVETPDHIATEVGFIAYLKFKEAFARAQGDDERADVAARAAGQFLTDHLSRVANSVASLLDGSHLKYLASAAQALASRVGARPTSGLLPMVPPSLDDDETGEFLCGLP
jgi:nitrate reductase assembly molybdenum cofactor insertion protein NarJ